MTTEEKAKQAALDKAYKEAGLNAYFGNGFEAGYIAGHKADEKIVCAAIQITSTGKVYFGHRHDQCINSMNSELSWTMNRQQIKALEKEQGFYTSKCRFVGRKEALKIALENNQVVDIGNIRGEELYSEDLY